HTPAVPAPARSRTGRASRPGRFEPEGNRPAVRCRPAAPGLHVTGRASRSHGQGAGSARPACELRVWPLPGGRSVVFFNLLKGIVWRPRTSRYNSPRRTALLHVEALEGRCLLSYTVTDLGALGGRLSAADGLNNLAQVVGFAETSFSDIHHAFLY